MISKSCGYDHYIVIYMYTTIDILTTYNTIIVNTAHHTILIIVIYILCGHMWLIYQ